MSKMLSSWKEIAHFFGKGVRTVQRWEKTLNLPIRRPPGAPSNVVLARTSDLEEWMQRSAALRGNTEELAADRQPDDLKAAIAELDSEVVKLIELHSGTHENVTDVTSDAITLVRTLTERVRTLREHDEHASLELKKVA